MTHQAKRPYAGSQPHITSYFPQSTSTSTSSTKQTHSYNISPSPSSTSDTRFPPLPHAIQSDLLSVGMRVRKSVPEGYKTGSTYSGFTLYSDFHSPTQTSTPLSPTLPLQRKGPRPRARELTPFCGILKVGGLAGQQWGIYNPSCKYNEEVMDDDEEEEEEEEEMGLPGLTSSQESATSASSAGSMGNKRRFFEDEEGEEDNGDSGRMGLGERVLAVPRRKKWAGMVGKGQGQENVDVNVNSAVGVVGQDIDFGEADFLNYGLVMDGEVEMGGV